MIEVDAAPTSAVLTRAHPSELAQALPDLTLWHGAEDWFDMSDGAITAWTAMFGQGKAIPTKASIGQAQTGAIDDMTGLICREGVHSGLWSAQSVENAEALTLMIRWYTPPGSEARTLLTLSTEENYLFLSEENGRLRVQDDQGQIAVHLELPQRDTARIAIVSIDGTRVSVHVDDCFGHATADASFLKGTGDVFIGCRSHKSGLGKTLGSALILEVGLLARAALSPEALKAFQRYHLWAAG